MEYGRKDLIDHFSLEKPFRLYYRLDCNEWEKIKIRASCSLAPNYDARGCLLKKSRDSGIGWKDFKDAYNHSHVREAVSASGKYLQVDRARMALLD